MELPFFLGGPPPDPPNKSAWRPPRDMPMSTYPWVIHISIYLCLKYPHPTHPNGPTPPTVGVGLPMDTWIYGYIGISLGGLQADLSGRSGGGGAPPAKREVPFCTSVYLIQLMILIFSSFHAPVSL